MTATFNSTLEGPQYVDNASCICRLRTIPYQAWRCSGNATEDVLTTGKYYPPVDGTSPLNNDTEIWSGPKANTTVAYKVGGTNFRTLLPITDDSDSGSSVQDQVCTGQNDTEKSTVYYQQVDQIQDGIIPQLCFLKDAVPVTIQNGTSWDETGCNAGFFCKLE